MDSKTAKAVIYAETLRKKLEYYFEMGDIEEALAYNRRLYIYYTNLNIEASTYWNVYNQLSQTMSI